MAFSDELTVNFSPKINVIIGENATGKTQLLKLLAINANGVLKHEGKQGSNDPDFTDWLTSRILEYFLPLNGELGNLCHSFASDKCTLEYKEINGKYYSIDFSKDSKKIEFNFNNYRWDYDQRVFIPTKEMLSFMLGFGSLYDKYNLSFDGTYRNLYMLLEMPTLRAKNLSENTSTLLKTIESICGGRFVFHGGGKVTFQGKGNIEYSANGVAEGIRKMGILYRLLETGAINPGKSGPLLWDEPESNMNPKLMKLLVEVLLELSRNGQQVILTTHDYVLLKWFDLLMDKGKDDHVRYHTLYRDKNDVVQIKSTDDYKVIANNPISEAFTDLTVAHAQARLQRV